MSEENPNTVIIPLERWLSFRRKLPYGIVKTGFMLNEEDRCELLPNPEHIYFIEQGFNYVEAGSSLREVADWVSQKIHRNVTYQTLSTLYNQYRKPWVRTRTQKRKRASPTAATKKLLQAHAVARASLKKVKEVEKKIEQKRKQLQPAHWDSPKPTHNLPPTYSTLPDDPNSVEIKYLFKPNPGPQYRFLEATEEEVLYGGSAGGGKSFAMIADPMRYFSNPNFVGLLLRRTNDELRELIRETQKLYPKLGGKWKEQASKWVFPSGAEHWITYLDRDDDVLRYQGQSFCWIGIDELTQYSTPYAWNYLKSRLRSTDPTLQSHLSMRATTNPGGPGHGWVKKMFVDPAVPGEAYWATDIDTGEVMTYPQNFKDPDKAGQPLFRRLFIPAKLSDNPYLAEDGTYERSLLGLPEDQRRKLLDGDWSIMEGAAFSEFSQKIHVVPRDTPIHPSWRRFRSADFGYSSFSCVLWFAIEPGTGILYVYRELYVSKKTGLELADMVLELEQRDRVDYGVLDSSVWHKRGHNGPSIAEEMIARGCRWRPSDRGDGSRVAGKNRLHELLKVDPYSEQPGILFLENCRQIIADLPMLPTDPDGGEDIDSRYQSDHSYDALRYGIMSRPKTQTWNDFERTKPTQQYRPADPIFGY